MEAKAWLADGKLRKCYAEGIAVLIQALNIMHVEQTYQMTGTVVDLARTLGLPEHQTEEGIRQIKEHGVLDVSQNVTGEVTLLSRRWKRDHDERENARLRKQRQRSRGRKPFDDPDSHGDVTPPVTKPHAGARAHSLSYSSSEGGENGGTGENGSPREEPRAPWAPEESVFVKWFVENAGLTYSGNKRKASREASLCFHHYEARGWEDQYERPLRNWRSLAKTWMGREGEFGAAGAGAKAPEAVGIDAFREVE